ncbi:helix-turn-helix domain-containing protein, partial [Paraburkholderia sabiae]
QHGTKKHFPTAIKDTLLSYRWPGNVRELKNYVQRAYIMSRPDTHETAIVPVQISPDPFAVRSTVTIPFGTALEDVDRQLKLATLEHCGGNRTRAAEVLGISLKTIYNRLSEYKANEKGKDEDAEMTKKGAV